MVTIPDLFLQLEKADGSTSYFETGDENKCNWMMFVRPAATFAEQNLVAYQHGQDIYFTVIKNIEPRQELKVLRMSCLKPILNWANVCSPEHTSDTSTKYDSFHN